MLKRSLLLTLLFLLAGGLAWFNPAPTPEQQQQSRWIKVNASGKHLPAWAGPWKCVFDSSTQLLWEVKSYAEDIHDHQCSFSWFVNGKGSAKAGDCFIEGEASDTQDLITAANARSYCGNTRWRLPTEAELQTLLYNQPKPGEPLIARDYFPYAKRAPYWTSNAGHVLLEKHFQHLKEGAIAIDFATGESKSMPYRNATFVRLVSSIDKEL